MFKKTVLILTISIMALATLAMGSHVQAQGGTVNFAGTIDNSSGCMLIGIPGNAVPATITPFTVPVAGDYTFTYQSHSWSGELYAYIVVAPYDPSVDVYSQDTAPGPSSHPQLPGVVTITLEDADATYYLVVMNAESIDTYAECIARTSTNSGSYLITSTVPVNDEGPAAPSDIETVPVPGCDLSVQRPANAVVGAFTAQADLCWAPGEKLYPPLALEAGQSVWVLGEDESGLYKQIQLSCQFLWVETSVIGPNYDAVWNGAPLPTDVVN